LFSVQRVDFAPLSGCFREGMGSRGSNPISANLMRPFQAGEWLLSRRDRLIVGRHEVPAKSFPERTVP
jgi:hypothetical protein